MPKKYSFKIILHASTLHTPVVIAEKTSTSARIYFILTIHSHFTFDFVLMKCDEGLLLKIWTTLYMFDSSPFYFCFDFIFQVGDTATQLCSYERLSLIPSLTLYMFDGSSRMHHCTFSYFVLSLLKTQINFAFVCSYHASNPC